MDKQKVIKLYLENVSKLTRLPFITDAEMEQLFGEEVASILGQISRYDEETHLCRDCQKRCCPVAQCELYDTHFTSCPIYSLRPVVCRLHFCHLFQKDCAQWVTELSDIFFECLLAGEAVGISSTTLFDCPPIVRCAPEFVTATVPTMQALKDQSIISGEAVRKIFNEAQRHRV